MPAAHVLPVPRLRHVVAHALPHLVESMVVPVLLFYATLRVAGLGAAIVAALVWGWAAVALRLLRRQSIPGMLVIATGLLTLRSALGLATGSGLVYFLQPALTPVLLAGAFVVSVMAGRPLAERLARELLPLPDALVSRPWVRAFFSRITLWWAAVFVCNAAVSVWMLLEVQLGAFVVGRAAFSLGLTLAAVAGSTVAFLVTARRNGTVVAWRGTSPQASPAPHADERMVVSLP